MKKPVFYLLVLILFSFCFKLFSQEITPQRLFESYNKSVVVIICYDQNGKKKAQGSGVILEDRGIVITNFHLFAGSDKFDVLRNDSTIGYTEITGVNIEKDVMVFKLYKSDFPKIALGNSSSLSVGDKVYAIGSPKGLENSISEGMVSGFRKLGENKRNMIQITASISPGSSGGAVFNSSGELIGISSMKVADGENLNFMIPINEVLAVVDSGLYEKQTITALKFLYAGKDAVEEAKYTEAIDNFTKYIGMAPPECRAYNYRGRAYLHKKDFEKALKDFQAALKIDNEYVPSICNRGECYFLMEEYDMAIKDFSKVLKMNSEYWYAYYVRGLTYGKMDEHKKAIKDYTTFLNHDPSNVSCLINRGISYFHMEEWDKAILDWKLVMSLEPGYEKSMQKNIDLANFMKWNK
ncbi:MAG: trypsin-like peptidase domain-containing protein [Ignavibacteriae bacterium]|nr:trypsin-like peptidase domain-containing protein [Ignavibacteriota bacterium]